MGSLHFLANFWPITIAQMPSTLGRNARTILDLRSDILKNRWTGRKMTGIRKSVSFGNMRSSMISHSKCLFQDAKDTGEVSSSMESR